MVVLKKSPPINFAMFMRAFLFYLSLGALLFLAPVQALFAQSDPEADRLLTRVSEQMEQYDAVHAQYTSKMVDLQSDLEMDQAGKVWIEGGKYHLELGDYVIVCDGQTVWTYEPEMGECYVDDAETIAEDGIDPARMFTIWEDGFKKVWKGPTDIDGRTLSRVDLHPDGADQRSFHTIQCYIDEKALQVVRLVVKGREGTDVVYDVNVFEGNGTIPEGAFTFDQAKYPGTAIIDNRL
jgi:outer membrane lipoprotein-sorting protein